MYRSSMRWSARSLELALQTFQNRVKCYAPPHAILELGGTFGAVSGGLSDAATGQLGPRWVSARHPPCPWTRGSRIIDIMPDGKVWPMASTCSRSTAPGASTSRTTIPSRSYKPMVARRHRRHLDGQDWPSQRLAPRANRSHGCRWVSRAKCSASIPTASLTPMVRGPAADPRFARARSPPTSLPSLKPGAVGWLRHLRTVGRDRNWLRHGRGSGRTTAAVPPCQIDRRSRHPPTQTDRTGGTCGPAKRDWRGVAAEPARKWVIPTASP